MSIRAATMIDAVHVSQARRWHRGPDPVPGLTAHPAKPSAAPGLEDRSGTWWIDTLTGDLKLEAIAPNGVRLTLAYQDTAEDAPPTDTDLAFLVPLASTALGRLP